MSVNPENRADIYFFLFHLPPQLRKFSEYDRDRTFLVSAIASFSENDRRRSEMAIAQPAKKMLYFKNKGLFRVAIMKSGILAITALLIVVGFNATGDPVSSSDSVNQKEDLARTFVSYATRLAPK